LKIYGRGGVDAKNDPKVFSPPPQLCLSSRKRRSPYLPDSSELGMERY